MSINLYDFPASGPCRSVRLVASTLGVQLNLKYVDLVAGQQHKPEFIKMNPQHAVPVLDDDGFYVCESRSICTYLCEKYGKYDSFYPKDPQQRAIVNQRLYFDMGTLYQSFMDYYIQQVFFGKPADPTKLEKINEAFKYLETYLEGQEYVAGKTLTVADVVLLTSVSNFPVFGFDYNSYKNVVRWFKKVKSQIPKYDEINGEGLKVYKEVVDNFTKNKLFLDEKGTICQK